jgi:hypothetical protein
MAFLNVNLGEATSLAERFNYNADAAVDFWWAQSAEREASREFGLFFNLFFF